MRILLRKYVSKTLTSRQACKRKQNNKEAKERKDRFEGYPPEIVTEDGTVIKIHPEIFSEIIRV